jgi:endoglucanase
VGLLGALALTFAGVGVGTAAASTTVAPDHTLPTNSHFYIDPNSEAAQQALTDLKSNDVTDAITMGKLATWPEASWFTKGTPDEVYQGVHKVVAVAGLEQAVPVLVAYDIPLRDCGQYSSGGAQSDAAYQQWIASFASAIGNSRAVVILEPDALANLPSDCGQDPTGTLSAARIADINYAVGVLEAQPRTLVYLDAGHSQWHSTGDMASRLVQAGVANAQGFFLDVSNYQPTDQLDQYGTWISKCIWFGTPGLGPSWAAGHYTWCASQYYSGAAPNDGLPGDSVSPTDPSTWHWTDLWFTENAGTPPLAQLTHFVVDTSRNGLGAWTPAPGKYTGDPQTWCNPPNRGVGVRPTANTGVALVDAYLYVKTIGESDGSCTRGTAGPGDPEYGGSVDPAAGVWWPAQALTLAQNAVPALTFNIP